MYCIQNCLRQHKPLLTTNADRIRSMSNEELAKFMSAFHCNTQGWCVDDGEICQSMQGNYCNYMQITYNKDFNRYFEWLNKPAIN